MATTFRDRTPEFRSLTETLKKVGGIAAVNRGESDPPPSQSPPPPPSSGSEFNRRASRIGLGIHETSKKVARLAQLAKRSSMFDDPTLEIQELTVLIKNDITALNVALSDLHTLQSMEIADGNYSQDRIVHSTTVFEDLKSRLMGATKQLQNVLTARTENIKAHENRKQLFSKNALRENPFQQPAKSVTEPPPWSSIPSNVSGSSQPPTLSSSGVQSGNQLRRRLAIDSTPSQDMEASLLQQVVPRQENYSQSRAVALHSVESTITELGGIFTNLATMVAQQGELAIRIDDNMEESLANVEGARSALLRNLSQISSNRWLLIKIFAILIFFLIIFIIFLA